MMIRPCQHCQLYIYIYIYIYIYNQCAAYCPVPPHPPRSHHRLPTSYPPPLLSPPLLLGPLAPRLLPHPQAHCPSARTNHRSTRPRHANDQTVITSLFTSHCLSLANQFRHQTHEPHRPSHRGIVPHRTLHHFLVLLVDPLHLARWDRRLNKLRNNNHHMLPCP